MIQANEIRIGNWVEKGIFKVRVTLEILEGLIKDFEGLDGIKLTTEILEQNKFQRDGDTFTIFRLSLFYQEISGFFYYNFIDDNGSVRIDYIHQLQNLFFDLTREELEINF